MTEITAYTRPSGTVVVQAHIDGRKVAGATTKRSYPFLVVNLWERPSGFRPVVNTHGAVVDTVQKYTPTLTVFNGTGNREVAHRKARRNGGGYGSTTVVLRRHAADDTYSVDDAGWSARNTVKSAAAAEARWFAERTADHHQVLAKLPSGEWVRIGDPRRHFTYDQALVRWNTFEDDPSGFVDSIVRSEVDPEFADTRWATAADMEAARAAMAS